ncbi:MAG: hypothetical protein Q9178_003404 [Gyalolechia marmorata]
MANEEFELAYTGGAFQNHPMQRFLDFPGPYSADLPIIDQKQPQFSGKAQEPVASEYYRSPIPWPRIINTAPDPCSQETWSEWASLDQDSCSGTTGNTWSPQATESCSDYEPRYPSWTVSGPLPSGYGCPVYSRGHVQEAGTTGSHSFTGALREIQHYPDTEAEDGSMKGEMPTSGHVYPAIAARRESGTASFNHAEGLGSSVNGSPIASPNTEDENVAIESVNGDSENGSNYSSQKRVTRSRKPRIHPRSQGSISPTARRLSSTKSKPHQLTQPAKITKRPASAPKANVPAHSLPSSHTPTSTAHTFRCTKPECSRAFPSASTLSKHVLSAHTRPFTCSFARYGCRSTFGSKNEWKRHVSSIHLCLGIYQCDVGTSYFSQPGPRSRNNNHSASTPSSLHSSINPQQQQPQQLAGGCGYKSNRKDLFTQHLNRMHHPANSASGVEKEYFEKNLEEVRQRCWVPLREAPPRSSCGYCAPHPSRPASASGPELHDVHGSNNSTSKKTQNKPFIGRGSWDERMEHVGRHLEKGTVGVEVEDLELRKWMLEQGLLEVAKGGGYRVIGVGGKRRGRSATAAAAGAAVKEEVVEVGEEDADGEDEEV